jgi:phosphatidylserine/phosphatidylglycerophosphate/cardiolipin synthase-like enzyme
MPCVRLVLDIGELRGLNWVRQGRIRPNEADRMAIPRAEAGSSGGWDEALHAAEALRRALPGVGRDPEYVQARLRDALAARNDAVLTLLGVLDPKHTEALLPELLERALSHRDTVAVRRLLSRLPAANARKSVPAAVREQLRKTPDDDAHRRMAELLAYLGLDAALAALIRSAANSPDPHVREVADDFGG